MEAAEKPPDSSMDYADPEASASHGTKRKKPSSESEVAPNQNELYSVVDENLLPLVDSANNCPKCSIKAQVNHVLVCCCCNKRFHGYCKYVKDTVSGEKPIPAKTWIEHFVDHLCGTNNGDYITGRFSWTCASCLNVKDASKPSNLPDRMNRVESLLVKSSGIYQSQFESMNSALSSLQLQMAELLASRGATAAPAALPSITGPPSAKSFADVSATNSDLSSQVPATSSVATEKTSNVWRSPMSSGPQHPINSLEPPQAPRAVKQIKANGKPAKFSIKLTKKEEGLALVKVLEKLAFENKIESYDFRSRGKFAIDLLFCDASLVDCAYKSLVNVFPTNGGSMVTVGQPEMIAPNRTYFVGMPENASADDVLSMLDNRYPNLSLKDKNKYCITILDPRKCTQNTDLLRSTVLLSDELYAFFMDGLDGKVPLGNYTRLYVYKCTTRCIKCQSFKHTFHTCPKKVSVCGHCGGNHYTKKCPNKNDPEKLHCVNCFSSPKFKAGCKGHGAIDNKCPFYLEMVKNKDDY